MSNSLIKIFDESSTSLKVFEISNFVENGIDLMSDESFVVKGNKHNVNVGELLFIRNNKQDFFYYIDKVVNETEYTFKSVLEVFNQEVYLPKNDVNITIYQFIDRFFVNNTIDLLMNINYLDISLVDNDILNSKIAVNIQGNQDDIYNAKDVIIDTILGKRLTFDVLNDLNNGKIKLEIKPQVSFKKINLDNLSIFDLELPQLKKEANCIDVVLVETSSQIEVGRTIERFYLLDDNTISTNGGALNRVLPPKQIVSRETYETGDVVNAETLARDKLIDTNNYNFKFSIFDKNLMYEVENFKLGDLVDVYKNGNMYRSVLTAIIKHENKTEFRFGKNRIDILLNINRR